MRISDWSSDVCSSDLGNRPDAVDVLGAFRLGYFGDARRGQQPEQHTALHPALLVDERFQEPFDLLQTELSRAGVLGKAQVAETPRGIAFQLDLQTTQRRGPAKEDLQLGRKAVGADLGRLPLRLDELALVRFGDIE